MGWDGMGWGVLGRGGAGRAEVCWGGVGQVCRESSERGQQRPPKHGQTMLHLSNSDWGYVGWHAPSLGWEYIWLREYD